MQDGKTHFLSMYVIDRKGNLIENYRKHFLYTPDYKFCRDGECFKTVSIKNTLNQPIKIGLGICMDINPKDFIDYSKYELADFFKKENVDGISNHN